MAYIDNIKLILLSVLCAFALSGCKKSEQIGASEGEVIATAAPFAQKPLHEQYHIPPECVMNQCTWTVIKDQQIIKSANNGYLVKILVLNGHSSFEADGESLEDISKYPIKWGSNSEYYIFCSSYTPSMLFSYKGKYQIHFLDFAEPKSHSYKNSANIYSHICHNGEDWRDPSFAKRHGYQPLDSLAYPNEVKNPENIITIKPKQQAVEKLSLSDIPESDWNQLGLGCGCSFSSGKSEKLISGYEMAILRINGIQKTCPLNNDHMDQMFKGEASIDCGSTSIRITTSGDGEPNEDGRDYKGTMRVSEGAQSVSLKGILSCMC